MRMVKSSAPNGDTSLARFAPRSSILFWSHALLSEPIRIVVPCAPRNASPDNRDSRIPVSPRFGTPNRSPQFRENFKAARLRGAHLKVITEPRRCKPPEPLLTSNCPGPVPTPSHRTFRSGRRRDHAPNVADRVVVHPVPIVSHFDVAGIGIRCLWTVDAYVNSVR